MLKYPCPRCQKEVVWRNDNAFRPFCSEVCQQIDLGAWAQEEYTIVGDDQENDVSTGVLSPSQEEL